MNTKVAKQELFNRIDGDFLCGKVNFILYSSTRNQRKIKSKLKKFDGDLNYNFERAISRRRYVDKLNLEIVKKHVDCENQNMFNIVNYLTLIHEMVCDIELEIRDYILDECMKYASIFFSFYVENLKAYKNEIIRQLSDIGFYQYDVHINRYTLAIDDGVISVTLIDNSIDIYVEVDDISQKEISTLYTQAALYLCKMYGKNVNSLKLNRTSK